jgi:hypothetical protein
MLATNSPLFASGITQPLTFHGLRSFFLTPGEPFHTICFLHILIPPFCLPIDEATI